MRDLILNYNHHNAMYKNSGDEMHNKECLKILSAINKLSKQQQEFFNRHTPIGVFNLN